MTTVISDRLRTETKRDQLAQIKMKQLSESHEPVERKLTPEKAKNVDVKRLGELDEKKFRYLVNQDATATEKTAEGIRKFAADIAKLEKFVASKINQS
ncbi:MAG: hypothetical protein WA183_07915 [Chthoniobacterales bacterium]